MIFGMWVGARAEVAHAEFWAWHMSINYLICIIYAEIYPEPFSGTVCLTWMIFCMWVGLGPKVGMVTFTEVKGHQRSNAVNYVLWLSYLVKRSADASWEWWWPLCRSRVVRGRMGKLCAKATIFCQKMCWCKLRMMTFMEVKDHQRSNVVNYVIWLPYLVKRTADASLEWWWPSWRSKIIRGQIW